jgi:hypothetical protein
MKVGDLVKMKYEMWWKLRSRKDYVADVALVLEQTHNAVKVMLPNGLVKRGLIECWEVISESR